MELMIFLLRLMSNKVEKYWLKMTLMFVNKRSA